MKRTLWITTGDYDDTKYPIPPAPIQLVPGKCVHTPMPESYHARYEWCGEAMKKKHGLKCITCEGCGKWFLYLPKAEAEAELTRRRAAMVAADKTCRAEMAEDEEKRKSK